MKFHGGRPINYEKVPSDLSVDFGGLGIETRLPLGLGSLARHILQSTIMTLPLMHFAPGLFGVRASVYQTTILVAAATAVSLSAALTMRRKPVFTPSPRKTILPTLSAQEVAALPYPPDALPGWRDVTTPYGSMRVYESGPEDGERVLLVHGISTPAVALGDLAHELMKRGYRVMLFDLFGRGYSDAPDLAYDARLFVTQILLVLASSKVSWNSFHLVGYSLGGGLVVSFARYFPHLVSSATLLASGGLIRPYHVSWQSWLLYKSGLLPNSLVEWLVRRRIRPKDEDREAGPRPRQSTRVDIASAETKKYLPNGDSDASGGEEFDSARISRFRPGVTVSSVIRWQIDNHRGFIPAFISSMRNAPIYAPQEDWRVLAAILRERRERGSCETEIPPLGLHLGKILMVLGEDDPIVIKDETIEDARKVLGADGVEFVALPQGHELPITNSYGVANAMENFWRQQSIDWV
ncbi:alpha/beta-hydrolase [Hypoxylon cercidicola]|nr:alpha/beta-hydrolase [Hypoxylon cercidicola]